MRWRESLCRTPLLCCLASSWRWSHRFLSEYQRWPALSFHEEQGVVRRVIVINNHSIECPISLSTFPTAVAIIQRPCLCPCLSLFWCMSARMARWNSEGWNSPRIGRGNVASRRERRCKKSSSGRSFGDGRGTGGGDDSRRSCEEVMRTQNCRSSGTGSEEIGCWYGSRLSCGKDRSSRLLLEEEEEDDEEDEEEDDDDAEDSEDSDISILITGGAVTCSSSFSDDEESPSVTSLI